MAFLNTSKAKNVLKQFGNEFATAITEGKSAGLSINAAELANEILNNSECKLFRALDKAGKYLKESLLTRSTSHKTYDFSSIQSESSLNLQKFYKDILDNKYVDIVGNQSPIDKKTQDEIDFLLRKMSTSLGNAISLIKKNPTLAKATKEELDSMNSNSIVLANLDKLIPDNIKFSKESMNTSWRHCIVNNTLVPAGLTAVASPVISVALGLLGFVGVEAAYLFGLIEPALPMGILLGAAAIGGYGAIVGLVLPLAVAAGFLIASLFVLGNRNRIKTIAVKKEVIKINDYFRNALKCLNKASGLVRRNAKSTDTTAELPKEDPRINVLKKFVEEQNRLWEPYTTPENRKYTNKSEKDKENQKHKTGLIKVSDEKTSTIGKMKLGIAKTWAELEIK